MNVCVYMLPTRGRPPRRSYRSESNTIYRRFTYKGDMSTHAQGTDPRVIHIRVYPCIYIINVCIYMLMYIYTYIYIRADAYKPRLAAVLPVGATGKNQTRYPFISLVVLAELM